MKWHAALSLVAIAAHNTRQACAETLRCQTAYGTTSTSNVPTRTSTTTVNIPVYSDTGVASTIEYTMTTSYISVVGDKTITIPTGSSFLPLTDAPITVVTRGRPREKAFAQALSTSSGKRKTSSISTKKPFTSSRKTSTTSSSRRLSASSPRAPAASSYPENVLCTTTATHYHTTTRTNLYYVTGTTWRDEVSTLHVPTSTAYAACEDADNVLTRYQGKFIQGDPNVRSDGNSTCAGASGTGLGPDPPAYAGIACLSPRTCCEGAQQYNYTGWTWSNAGGIHSCGWLEGYWVFTNGYDDYGGAEGGSWGNGPSGTGYFEDIVFID